ncbi:hypothetical protein RclHR1_05550009 [Rhizophagus clarus]|uniref:CUE domain-containing protein n=1 Tax=Rhizophagus clarus TaxID=94130 RepID=A0A2Z6S684_9GLOM|nr:hypothetical protein RclHR1_05550009 [Rhizophagus clarus]GES93597.1 hypothetical protein GLOIN_2v1789557 [Rhizophagus clarus]
MSDFESLRSLFPQFTEEELKEAIEISKCPVNWIEYNKWVEEGSPYEEHDEVILNLKHEYESQTRSVGARKYTVGKGGCRNGVSTHRNSMNANQYTGKTSNKTPSTTRSKTTDRKKGEYRDQASGLRQVPNTFKIYRSNDPGSKTR